MGIRESFEELSPTAQVIVGLAAVIIGFFGLIILITMSAAVIGTFVLGLDDGADQQPQVIFSSDYNQSTETLTLSHVAGDSVNASNLTIAVDDSKYEWETGSEHLIEEGDETAISVQEPNSVEIIWEPEPGTQEVLYHTSSP